MKYYRLFEDKEAMYAGVASIPFEDKVIALEQKENSSWVSKGERSTELVFQITIPDTASTAYDRSIILPIYGLDLPTVRNAINGVDSGETTESLSMKMAAAENEQRIAAGKMTMQDANGDEYEIDAYDFHPMVEEEADYPVTLDEIYQFDVSWGDGLSNTFTDYNDEACWHVYEKPGIYLIKIMGKFGRIYTATGSTAQTNEVWRNRLTSVNAWGEVGLTSMANAFYGCRNLTTIPIVHFGSAFNNVTSFNQAFRDCSGLKGIPYDAENDRGLFDSTPNVTDFACLFLSCINMEGEIPIGLFKNCPNVTSFYYAFGNCRNLTGGLPVGMFDGAVNVSNVSYVFYGCSGLNGTIDPNLWKNNTKITTTFRAFAACTNLTGTIPNGLLESVTGLTDARCMFEVCPNITGIEPNVFANCGRDNIRFEQMFRNCSGLTELTEGLFDGITGTGITMNLMFEGCTNLTTIPTTLFRNIHDENTRAFDMFAGCTGLTCQVPDSPTTSTGTAMWQDKELVKKWNCAFCGCTGMTGRENVPEDVGGTAQRLNTILVGDVVLNDLTTVSPSEFVYSSDNEPIGVVYHYDESLPEGSRMRFIALNGNRTFKYQDMEAYNEAEYVDLPIEEFTSGVNNQSIYTNWMDGKACTDAIAAWSGYTNNPEYWPAINTCLTYSAGNLGSGSWYLPDLSELWYMHCHHTSINNTLTLINNTEATAQTLPIGAHWSVREYSTRNCWIVGLNTSYWNDINRWSTYYVRPVSAS